MSGRSVEDKERIRVEAMRRRNDERKGRFLNDRERQRGMDYEALQRQIEEKKRMAQLEEDRDRLLLEQQAAVVREQDTNEQKQRDQRRAAHQRTDAFNAMQAEMKYMAREVGRESSLGALAPTEPKPTVSGATLMSGEDPSAKERQKAQARQQQIWAAQQMHERAANKEKERQEDQEYEEQMAAVYARAEELMAEKRTAEAQRLAMLADENRQLAQLKKEREEAEIREENERSVKQAQYIQEDLETREQTLATASSTNANRVVTTEYRGMTANQIDAIHQEQLKQEELRQAKKEREEKEAQREAQELARQIRDATRYERQQQHRREAAAAATREENLRLAQAKAERDKQTRDAYENRVDDSFFSGFGTSVR